MSEIPNELEQRRHTAIHEAGHAVAHVRLGIDWEEACIVPEPELGRLGKAMGEGSRHVWSQEEAVPMMLAFYAGYAAVLCASYSEEVAVLGAGGDFTEAEELAEAWALGDPEAFKRQAVDLMGRPENVAAVARVAEGLMEVERMDCFEVEILVAIADGDDTEEGLNLYRALRPRP